MSNEPETATFEEIDWEAVESDVTDFPRTTIAEIITLLAWAGALAYDLFFVPADEPIIAGWTASAVEWLFILTLALGFFHIVIPLAENPRMTRHYWQQFKKNKAAVASLVYLCIVFAGGLIGPVLMAPPELNLANAYQPPVGFTAATTGTEVTGTWAHPFGTDHQGQDMFKLVVFGMRVSMQVGLISMVVAVTIGTLVGTTAAHFGGYPLDRELMSNAIDLLEDYDHLYLDTRYVRFRSVLERALLEHPDRVLFGSGAPEANPNVGVMEILTLDVSEDAMRRAFSSNASRIVPGLSPGET
jgi:peptide/nickel transport system permease protein